MRTTLTIAIIALTSLWVLTTSCRKTSQEAKRLFEDRLWHRTSIITTTCYDLATRQQVVSMTSATTELDTSFALKNIGNNQVEFLGRNMSLYHTGDTDQYIYSNGHGTNSFGFALFYAKPSNVIFAEMESAALVINSNQQTSCDVVRLDKWRSSNQ